METKTFGGLPELGISNGEDLKETLTNCTEPLKAIDQFQVTTVFHSALKVVVLVLEDDIKPVGRNVYAWII